MGHSPPCSQLQPQPQAPWVFLSLFNTSFLGFLTPLKWAATILFILAPCFLWVIEFPNSQLEDHVGKERDDLSCSYTVLPPFVSALPHQTSFPMREASIWVVPLTSWSSGPKFWNYRSSLKALSVSCSWITSLEKGESTKKYPPTSFQMNPQGSATSHSNKEIKGLCGNQSNPRECRFPKDQISVYLNLCPQHLEHDWPILVVKKYIEWLTEKMK